MNRNIQEVRQRNLEGKRGLVAKPPPAFKKPVIKKVMIIYSI
jgi:hypothetical protein